MKAGTYQPSDIGRTDITVYIATSQNSVSGTAGNPITIKSEVPLGAVIKIMSINAGTAGFYVGKPYYIIEGFDINGEGVTQNTGASASQAGITVSASNVTIRRNHIWSIARTMCNGTPLGQSGILVTNNQQNTLIEYNQFNKIGRLKLGESGCVIDDYQHDHGIYDAGGDNTLVQHNVFYDNNRGYAYHVYANGTDHINNVFQFNTIDNGTPDTRITGAVIFCNTVSGARVQNNIVRNPAHGYLVAWCAGTTATDMLVRNNISNTEDEDAINDMMNPSAKPAGATASGNIFNATLGLKNTTAGSEDFSLTASSQAINAGLNVGNSFNGSAPDMGAFETVVFSSCTATASAKIQVSYTNNLNPPLRPSTGVTAFTARKNAASNPLSGSGVVVGDNIVELTVTNAQAGGDTIDISLATTNMTDSSLIGGIMNQPVIQTLTNQSCTNNLTGGGPTFTLTQAAFELHDAFGTEASPTILPLGWPSTGAAENISIAYPVYGGGKLRIRFAVTCAVASCPDAGYLLRYSRNSGSYTQVPDNAGDDGVQFCGVIAGSPTNGSATTNQLSTAGTFTAGGIVYTSNAIPLITGLAAGNKTELEFCVKYTPTASGLFEFRVYTQDGNPLTFYSFTPKNLIVNPAFGSF